MKKLLPYIFVLILILSCKNDDVIIPQCSEATNIQSINITFNSTSLSWNDANDTASFTIEYGVSGFLPGTGALINSAAPNIDLSGLIANTTYDIYVQSVCSTTNLSMQSNVYSFSTLPPLVVPQFLQNLSDLNIYLGDLSDLEPTVYAFDYELSTPLFSDYARKQRIIALPNGTQMEFVNDLLPNFPDNTLIAKTFYYYVDERDESLGKIIIETRVLIKLNGEWQSGNYIWNNEQTDAVLDLDGAPLEINYIDENGDTNQVNYVIPSNQDCFTCHGNAGSLVLIGPKLRTLNFDNQLQDFINNSYISGLTDASTVTSLPSWDDTAFSREERSRAYFDINCAHCHSVGRILRSSIDFTISLRNCL